MGTMGVLLAVAILAVFFFVFGLLNLLVQNLIRLRRARRRVGVGGGGSSTALQGQLQQLFHLHDAGVDQAFIDALPVLVYSAVGGGGAQGAGRKGDPFDCAVCLCEFGMDDKLRLLPTCGHAFHVPCIDAWLMSHSTCPLCRSSVLAAELSEASGPVVLVLESETETHADTARDGEATGGRDSEVSSKTEEIVEVKLGKLRCVDSNGDSGDLVTTSGNLGQRRSLSMGSYEYVMDEHAALRVAIKMPKRRPASFRSRRRHALSECDLGDAKKGACKAAVAEAAPADAGAAAARQLNKDSFSLSKIWILPGKKVDGRTAETAGDRRSVSFQWPAMAHANTREEHPDLEAGSFADNGVSSLAEDTPSFTWTRVAGGWRQSSSSGSHS